MGEEDLDAAMGEEVEPEDTDTAMGEEVEPDMDLDAAMVEEVEPVVAEGLVLDLVDGAMVEEEPDMAEDLPTKMPMENDLGQGGMVGTPRESNRTRASR
jgi:hypothetical protein